LGDEDLKDLRAFFQINICISKDFNTLIIRIACFEVQKQLKKKTTKSKIVTMEQMENEFILIDVNIIQSLNLSIRKLPLSAHFWVGFFFPKIPLIFNTNNTCNK